MTREMTGSILVKDHPLYRRWCFMRNVCRNPKHADYPKYGARGINVGSEFEEFWDFVDIIENRLGYPDDFGYLWKLARKDQSGDYTIKNLIWEQASQVGRRCPRTYTLTHKGKTKPVRTWSEETGINFHTLIGRIERGWTSSQVLGLKPGPKEIYLKKKKR